MKTNSQSKHGNLIVIDGSDGSGKATQTALLVEALKEDDEQVETIDFPRYDSNHFGELIGECLAGEHGDFTALDPKIASVLYAADRFESAPQIREWLDDGATVIADRYVSANQMHQGGKIDGPEKRREFLLWLDKMEYDVFGIPRPDLILYLDVPVPTTKKLLKENKEELAEKKQYLRRCADMAEEDDEYLENSQQTAAEIVKERNKWRRIECNEGGELLSKKDIHERIYSIVDELIA